MSMKRVLSILVCVLLVLSSFCAFAEEEDTIKWGTCVVGIDDYTNAILTGGRDICEEFGWEHYEYSAEYDVQKQVNAIESAITAGLDGMFIQDLDFVSVAPIIKKALDAGMLIIVPETFREYMDEYENHENLYYVYWDEEELGYLLGDALFTEMEEAGKSQVYCIAGTQGRVVITNRTNGYLRALEEHPDINSINIVYIENDDRSKAMAAAEDALISNPEVEAFFVENEAMGWGVQEACELAGRTDIMIAVCDCSTTTREMIKDGRLTVTGIDGVPWVGTVSGAKILKAKLDGTPLEDAVDWYDMDQHLVLSTNEIYTAETIDNYTAIY